MYEFIVTDTFGNEIKRIDDGPGFIERIAELRKLHGALNIERARKEFLCGGPSSS